VQRTAAMINQYQDGVVGELPENSHDTSEFHQAVEDCRFDKALDSVWGQVRGLNQYIEEEKPWQISKEGEAGHLREILAYQVASLLSIAELLSPFMPDVSEKIVKIFENNMATLPKETLFPRVETKG
jgi:methionyl-tRNA synthetase